jgi:predicted P-loop ATPase/GTPase
MFDTVDRLAPEEFEALYQHIIERRRQQLPRVWVVPAENLRKIQELLRPVQEEVNRIIDEALTEVRRERQNRSLESER